MERLFLLLALFVVSSFRMLAESLVVGIDGQNRLAALETGSTACCSTKLLRSELYLLLISIRSFFLLSFTAAIKIEGALWNSFHVFAVSPDIILQEEDQRGNLSRDTHI